MKSILMNPKRTFLLLAIIAACFSATAQAKEKPKKNRGPIIAVDVAAKTVTIDHKKKGELVLQCAPDVKVKPKTVGGLEGLKPGMFVITYTPAEGGDVYSIRHTPESDVKPEQVVK